VVGERRLRRDVDVEVDVFRIADAAEEEAKVAAALDRVAPFLRSRGEHAHELEMEQLDDLAVAPTARFDGCRLWTHRSITCFQEAD